jgi:hypothetical protein
MASFTEQSDRLRVMSFGILELGVDVLVANNGHSANDAAEATLLTDLPLGCLGNRPAEAESIGRGYFSSTRKLM